MTPAAYLDPLNSRRTTPRRKVKARTRGWPTPAPSGMTQQRCTPRLVLEVGMSSVVPLPVLSDRRSFVVIIGIDPHKQTNTASALEPDSHRGLATLQIDAALTGYRQLARWAARFEVRRSAVENARGVAWFWLACGWAGRRCCRDDARGAGPEVASGNA
jgi:hypothetical protein